MNPSDELSQLERRHLWHPFTQMRDWESEEPLFIDSARGVMLTDRSGKQYFDGNSSMWLNVHGHRRPEIDRAIIDQLGKVAHSTLLGLTHEPAARLAARLAEIAPKSNGSENPLTRVFFSDDGSTAVEVALKMAFQYSKQCGERANRADRTHFLALAEGYHGDTIGAVSVGRIGRFHSLFQPLLFPVDFVESPSAFPDAKSAVVPLKALLEANPNRFFALILEPLVQLAGGVLVQPPGYLTRVRELCDTYDILLIADEVATGFGRTGALFACGQAGIVPDFLCLGKGLTGGYLPLAATLATERIYDAFLAEYGEWKSFTHGHSYTGNPLACAAALASLDLFVSDELLTHLPGRVRCLSAGLERFRLLYHVNDVRQCGMIAGLELVKDRDSQEEYALADAIGLRVCRRARELGLITRPLGNVITLLPPLVSTPEEIEAMLQILYSAIRSTTREAEDD